MEPARAVPAPWLRGLLRAFGLAVTLAALTSAAPAAAQPSRAAILPAGGDGALPPAVREEAVDALVQALASEGVDVITPKRAKRQLRGTELASCARTDCADELAQALAADFAAGVAVWPGEDGDGPGTVAVSLITPAAQTFPGAAPVEGRDVATATRVAFAAARDRQRLGPGPWVHVRGEPAGAQVRIDGTAVGVVPYRGAIPPGRHEVEVRLHGYAARTRTVDVPLGEHEEVELDVQLDPEGAPAASRQKPAPVTGPEPGSAPPMEPEAPPSDRVSAWNWVVAGGLAAAAVPALVSSLRTLANDGDIESMTDTTVTRVDFGARSGVLLGLGIAALAGATYVAAARPLRIDVEASPDHAVLRLTHRF
jgi:hypothetical protein